MSDAEKGSGSHRIWLAIACLPLVYVLASGPLFGLAFWLRESTGYDEFYSVFYLYAPLFLWCPEPLMDYVLGPYIEWWVVDVFHTVGPG
ncbi:hypothetical protein [Rubinisphaera margarita]|uniref:hypothetical protein n=1 Tax=Rubinisphaera margarita TaxID=2909586 RepID=UPI001EE8C17A|nr:hypothetical protein [Rubinisphaera margarita]MCG6156737.1 hypothetical protein [Rubinisphaera margarita]